LECSKFKNLSSTTYRIISATTWSSELISVILTYSSALWDSRNSTLHGRIIEEQRAKEVAAFSQEILKTYKAYKKDPFIIPRTLSPLFTSRTLQQRLSQDVDSMKCWLWPYKERILTQKLHIQQNIGSKKVFIPRNRNIFTSTPLPQPLLVTTSSGTSYSGSTDSFGSSASFTVSMSSSSMSMTTNTAASSQSSSTASQ
jgi:hypothetical protein